MKKLIPHAHWLLRAALAGVFLYHGWPKFGGAQAMATMMSMPVLVIYLVALAEVAGALLLVIGGFGPGWLTRIGGLLIIPVMLGAIIKVHWGQWSFLPSETHPLGGIEFQVVLLAVALYFAIKGNEC